jgi:hypothetical protein
VRAFSVHSFVDLDMAIDPDFVDYYELLEVSSNASTATVERIFRYLAKPHHPDSSEHRATVPLCVFLFRPSFGPQFSSQLDRLEKR